MCDSRKAFRKNVGRVRRFKRFIGGCVSQGLEEREYNNTDMAYSAPVHDNSNNINSTHISSDAPEQAYGKDLNSTDLAYHATVREYSNDINNIELACDAPAYDYGKDMNSLERARDSAEYVTSDIVGVCRSTYEYDLVAAFDKALANQLNGKNRHQGHHKSKHSTMTAYGRGNGNTLR
jgi:hypothetical protein